jgi:hypothetical protein
VVVVVEPSTAVELLVEVEVVDVVAQPAGPQASQQLEKALGQPPCATQRAALEA